jgi:hypothetical protein
VLVVVEYLESLITLKRGDDVELQVWGRNLGSHEMSTILYKRRGSWVDPLRARPEILVFHKITDFRGAGCEIIAN